MAEEVKDAKRNVPRALLLSLAVSIIVYVLVGIVAVGLVGSSKLADSNSPLTEAISAAGSPIGMQIVSFGGLLATASVLLTSILGVSRMAYSMARRRDMPQALAASSSPKAVWTIAPLKISAVYPAVFRAKAASAQA